MGCNKKGQCTKVGENADRDFLFLLCSRCMLFLFFWGDKTFDVSLYWWDNRV